MTNSQTFFLVIFTLVLVAGPFAGIVYSLVKRSRETYDILKEPKVYRTSASRFFLSFDSCAAFMMIFFAGIFFSMIIKFANSYHGADRPTYLALVFLVLLFGGLATHIQYIHFNHWKHSRNLTITFDPQSETVWVDQNAKRYILTSGTIKRVEVHSTKSHKMPFEYFKFYLQNGDTLSISGKAKGVYRIFEYFKNLPTMQHYSYLPLISDSLI